jgi:hypothetical protein
MRARTDRIKTVKIDYYPTMGRITNNTLLCEYYFCPNKISESLYRSWPQNKTVKYLPGGFPFWDSYALCRYQPSAKPGIIAFFSQYGYESGFFGSRGPVFYIDQIISAMPDGYELQIKLHPLDDPNRYVKYKGMTNVKVCSGKSVNNIELFSRAAFVFSIYSYSTFEAKHICPNSYYINYEPQMVKDFDYGLISDYIDVVSNPEELKAVLTAEREPKEQARFISYFNPAYPNTIGKLKEVICALQE